MGFSQKKLTFLKVQCPFLRVAMVVNQKVLLLEKLYLRQK